MHIVPSLHVVVSAIGPQVPSTAPPAAIEHARQSVVPPPHALAQHTPSVQNPLEQSALLAQAAPFVLSA